MADRRYPERDRVMVLLSVRAGLRAKEIALATWGMVTDAEGSIGDALHLVNGASKGKKGGRTVPLNKELRAALIVLKAEPVAQLFAPSPRWPPPRRNFVMEALGRPHNL